MRRFYRSLNQRLARSRRRIAMHEAGHFVVGRHLGYEPLDYYIVKDWLLDTYHGIVTVTRINAPHHLRLFAVAGGVAVCCWENLETVEAYRFLSDSDWELTGCARGEPDGACSEAFEVARSLLRRGGPLWSDLIIRARRFIISARLEEQFDKFRDEVEARDRAEQRRWRRASIRAGRDRRS
jgi:hypothetical protein